MKKMIASSLAIITLICGGYLFLQKSQTLKVALKALPSSTDYIHELSFSNFIMANLIHDPLVIWKGSDNFSPYIVKKWSKKNDKTTLFEIQKGIKFYSGKELTTKEIKWTFEKIKRSQEYFILFNSIETFNIIDKYNFELIANKQFPTSLLALSFVFPQDPDMGDEHYDRNINGTGPFRIKDIILKKPRNAKEFSKVIKLEKKSNYWNNSNINALKSIEIYNDNKKDSRTLKISSNAYDIAYPISPDNQLKNKQIEGYNLSATKNSTSIILHLNQDKIDFFMRKNIRKGIQYAIDQKKITQIVGGKTRPASQIIPPEMIGHDGKAQILFDREKAIEVFKKENFTPRTLTLAYPKDRYSNTERVAMAIKEQLQDVGIKLVTKGYSYKNYWKTYYKCDADILLIGWFSDTNDPAVFFEFLAMSSKSKKEFGKYNCGNFSDPKIDELVLKSALEPNKATRKELLAEVNRYITDESLIIPLYWENYHYGYNKTLKIDKSISPINIIRIPDIKLPSLYKSVSPINIFRVLDIKLPSLF